MLWSRVAWAEETNKGFDTMILLLIASSAEQTHCSLAVLPSVLVALGGGAICTTEIREELYMLKFLEMLQEQLCPGDQSALIDVSL